MDIGEHGPAGAITEMKRFVGFLMVLALLATILAWMGLNRGLLEPLRTLTSSMQQVGAGTLQQEISVPDNHELGTLARSFNRMAMQVREYRASASGELSRLNMTIRATLASFPDPIFVLNSEGAVEFRNPEADQLAMQLLFSGVTRLPRKVDEKVEDVRRTGKDYLPTLFQEAIKFHLNGQDRYFLPRIVLLRNEKKETFGVAVILEDVTRMLLLDDVKSNLIATVSHELKTPLTSVRMAIYLLHERTVGELNAKQADLILTAREDADRLLRTLNDLLDLAKLEQGATSLALTRATPAEIIQGSVQETREVAHAAGMTVTVEIDPGLPGVEVDRQRIAYVLSNLLTNAIKYSPEGSAILVRGEMGTMREGKPAVRISVKDQGPGISPEHQEHIFERFYRVPGTEKKGAGLGLSIAREIATAHHGEIGVISVPGSGCEFFFLLPAALQSTEQTQSQIATKAQEEKSDESA
jgi:signal transduction histidine kinase/HAMP domain-containing protein